MGGLGGGGGGEVVGFRVYGLGFRVWGELYAAEVGVGLASKPRVQGLRACGMDGPSTVGV